MNLSAILTDAEKENLYNKNSCWQRKSKTIARSATEKEIAIQ